MQIKDICSLLEMKAPLSLQESYDNVGLIVGDALATCTGVLCCLDITLEVIEEAKQKNVNLIIAHHPIVFYPLKQIVSHRFVDSIVMAAVRYDIHLYAIHTNVDNVLNGVSITMANALGLKKVELLLKKDHHSLKNIGSGCVGYLSQPMEIEIFLRLLQQAFGLKVIKHTKVSISHVHKIAMCGGAGKFLLPIAIEKKADVFVSSDFTYHDFFGIPSSIMVADIGHGESEQFVASHIATWIKEAYPCISLFISQIKTNPIDYFI